MRTALADREGQTCTFTGKLSRKGTLKGAKHHKTWLITSLKDASTEEQEILTNHIWIRMVPAIDCVKCWVGDQVTFEAQVQPYAKIHLKSTDKLTSMDFGLVNFKLLRVVPGEDRLRKEQAKRDREQAEKARVEREQRRRINQENAARNRAKLAEKQVALMRETLKMMPVIEEKRRNGEPLSEYEEKIVKRNSRTKKTAAYKKRRDERRRGV